MRQRLAALNHQLRTSAGSDAGATSCTPVCKQAVIDVHTHFYDPTRPGGVPWPTAEDPLLHRPALPADFMAIAGPCGVTGTVVVAASPLFEDNEWVLQQA